MSLKESKRDDVVIKLDGVSIKLDDVAAAMEYIKEKTEINGKKTGRKLAQSELRYVGNRVAVHGHEHLDGKRAIIGLGDCGRIAQIYRWLELSYIAGDDTACNSIKEMFARSPYDATQCPGTTKEIMDALAGGGIKADMIIHCIRLDMAKALLVGFSEETDYVMTYIVPCLDEDEISAIWLGIVKLAKEIATPRAYKSDYLEQAMAAMYITTEMKMGVWFPCAILQVGRAHGLREDDFGGYGLSRSNGVSFAAEEAGTMLFWNMNTSLSRIPYAGLPIFAHPNR